MPPESASRCFWSPDLQAVVARGFSEGLSDFGDLRLDLRSYTERVVAVVTKHLGQGAERAEVVAFVETLHGRDLYLATACAREGVAPTHGAIAGNHSSIAWRAFENAYNTFIESLVRFSFAQIVWRQDLADNMLADLFLPDSSGTSRIASYDGRSSLSAWLRVVVANRAINVRRAIGPPRPAPEELLDLPTSTNLDRVISVGRCEGPLFDSLTEAYKQLTSPESQLLLWRFKDNLQLGYIAQLLGIHQSSVSRRLQRIYRKLRNHVYRALSSQHGMSDAGIRECFEDVSENPHHWLSILDSVRAGPRSRPRIPHGSTGRGEAEMTGLR